MKTGRNDPCPCDSGLKFKRCCENLQKSSSLTQYIDVLTERQKTLLSVILIIILGLIAYHNCYQGAFIYDDSIKIVDNVGIRSMVWPWTFLEHTRRPFLYFTLALNYAYGGLDPVGYHIVNVVIHLMSALFLLQSSRQ